MTNEEALQILDTIPTIGDQVDALEMAIKALEQQPCEMTAEEYRQRMIQAFHNADTDELIAVCVLPTEKEFEHLEWLLKNHYKKAPCEDAISRDMALEKMADYVASGYADSAEDFEEYSRIICQLPSVTPTCEEREKGECPWYAG